MVLYRDANSLILNLNFVIRKQGVLQKFYKVAVEDGFELRGLTAGKFSLLLTCIGYTN